MLIHYDTPKFIFLHTPRTGGASIEHFLCGQFDRKGPGHGIKRRTRHGSIEHAEEKIRARKKNNDPDTYFKFAFIRNPWDRALSYYFHHFNEVEPAPALISKEHFNCWIKGELFAQPHKHPYYRGLPFLRSDGTLGVDRLCRFENYYDELDYLFTRYLDISMSKFPLKHTNTRPVDSNYQDWYEDEARWVVDKHSGFEIDEMGYTF